MAILTLTAALTGCIGSNDELAPASVVAALDGLLVTSADGTPLPAATATLVDTSGAPLATLSADANGIIPVPPATAGAVALIVTAPGYAAERLELNDLPAAVALTVETAAAVAPDDDVPVLRFLEPLLLGGAYLADEPATCEPYNCGASEPTVEVAGDGTIYASGVCCVGESPPIWYSTDGGATFDVLEGDALRDNFGIEGDFAIDDAGNLYFTDISVASAYIASWDGEQQHRWTVPAGPFIPVVDRPWVRAGAEDHVVFAYNTGRSTAVYTSDDGGLTWLFRADLPGGLGALGQGPARDDLWVAIGGTRTLHASSDGGETWSDGEPIPVPSEDGNRFAAYFVPVVDEAGNLWVVYDWREHGSQADDVPYHIYATRRDPSGGWHGPYQVSPTNGTHHLAWPAAGRDGTLVVAWYGTEDDEADPNRVGDNAEWYVYSAVTVDGTTDEPHFQVVKADPEPVHVGPMNRKLLDFLQVDIGPDGAVHLVYAQDRGDRPDELTQYVRSTTGLRLQPAEYPNGP